MYAFFLHQQLTRRMYVLGARGGRVHTLHAGCTKAFTVTSLDVRIADTCYHSVLEHRCISMRKCSRHPRNPLNGQ